MCAVSGLGTRAKAATLVQPRRRGVRRTQAKAVEPAQGCLVHCRDQLPPNPEPSERRQHIQVTHPADTLLGGIRVDVQPADANEPPTDPGREQRFAGPVEPIRPLAHASTSRRTRRNPACSLSASKASRPLGDNSVSRSMTAATMCLCRLAVALHPPHRVHALVRPVPPCVRTIETLPPDVHSSSPRQSHRP